jgi:hypothetical protein
VKELLTFIAWVHTNDAYPSSSRPALALPPISLATSFSYIGLPRPLRPSTWPLCR